MRRFSLDKHIKKETIKLPSWAEGAVRKLYIAVTERVKEIENLLNECDGDTIDKLKIKQRKIVPAQIADNLGVDRSNFREDRVGKLTEFIEKENRRLAQLWNNRRNSLGGGKKLSRDEIEELLKQKDKKIEALKQKNLHDYFDRAVESEVLHTQKDMSEKYIDIKREYQMEQNKNSELTKKIQALLREINS